MATKQFNLRLRDGLDRQVRMRAAELGVNPRDVIEDALVAAGLSRDAGGPVRGQGELPFAAPNGSARRVTPAMAEPAGGPPVGCPECGGDVVNGACGDCGWSPGASS